MPELPDVQIFRQYFARTSLHKKITHVDLKVTTLLKKVGKQTFIKTLKNNSFEKTYRHGKYLFVKLRDNKFLVIHFGMDGNVQYFKHPTEQPNYTALRLQFENKDFLAYYTVRKIGFLTIIEDMQAYIASKKLGPDALEIKFADFKKIIHKTPATVKSWLMNQRNICGVGNIYADEILFKERLYPKTKIAELSETQIKSFYKSIQLVLKTAIDCRVDAIKFPNNYLIRHRHKNGKCPRCDTKLEQIKFSGRTCYFCPHCQAPR